MTWQSRQILTMKILTKIAQWLFIICLPFFFLSAGIALAVNSLWLYTSGFEKQNVGATTGLDKTELEKTARGFISYWNSGDTYISLTALKEGQPFELFNQKEKEHLKDVKALFCLDYWVLSGTGIYALGYCLVHLRRRKARGLRRLAWDMAAGSGLTLALMLVLGLGALVGEDQFARFWFQFHIFSFANDLWQLDPSRDYLLMLVPEGFWFDAVRFIVFATTGMAVVFGGLASGFLFFKCQAQQSQPSNDKYERETGR